jgi:hypothetical protein
MGVYGVQVSNAGGAVSSVKVQVVVSGAPVVMKNPASFKNLTNNTVARLVGSARGSRPFNWVWKKDDGATISSGSCPGDGTEVELPLEVVASGTTMGSYRLVVWNEFGREESAPGTVELGIYSTRLLRHGWTVLLSPTDVLPGVNKVVGSFPSKSVTLDDTLIVSFGSVDTHTYEWGYSTLTSTVPKIIAGQTRPYLPLQAVPGLSTTTAYILQVKIVAKKTGATWIFKFGTNTLKAGAGPSVPAPVIGVDLSDAYVPGGGTGNFGVALAVNGGQYGCTFNWFKQGLTGAAVPVGSNSTGFFSVPNAGSVDDADYYVVVVDSLGRSVESRRAHLWVFVDGE